MNSPLISAFPVNLAHYASSLASLLDPPSGLQNSKPFTVLCDGETLEIPQRIYQPVISESQFASLPPFERSIAACWFTRHHDGYVRERFLRTLPAFDSSWVIAYVTTLCGEYVKELLHYIWEHRTLFDAAVLGCWLRDNPEFYFRIRSRIVSYWDCYYRSDYPHFESYVGSQLLTFFDECCSMIYVRLLDEGIEVWRPVSAERVRNTIYRIIESPANDTEHWEFKAGETVCCQEKSFADGKRGLVAYERATD